MAVVSGLMSEFPMLQYRQGREIRPWRRWWWALAGRPRHAVRLEHIDLSLRGLFPLLSPLPAYRRVVDGLVGGGRADISALEPAKPYLLSALWRELDRPMVLVCPRPDDARRMVEQLLAYCGDGAPIYHFAESEVLPYERLALDPGTVHERLTALGSLRGALPGGPSLIVASAAGLMQRTLSPKLVDDLTHVVRRGEKLSLEPLLQQWARMGYRFEPVVEGPGTVSRRGGIIDVFPTGHLQPVRIELWGTQVDTIRWFDAASQRSGDETESVTILPAWEVLPTLAAHDEVTEHVRALDFSASATSERDRIQEELAELMAGAIPEAAAFYAGFFNSHTLLDHLMPDSGAIVVLNEEAEVLEAARQWEDGAKNLRLAKQERGELPLGFPSNLTDWDTVTTGISGWATQLSISRWHGGPGHGASVLPFVSAPSYHSRLEALGEDLQSAHRAPVVIASQHSQRLQEVLKESDVGAREMRSLDGPPEQGSVSVVHVPVAGGWELRSDEADGAPAVVTLLSDAEVFGTAKRRTTRRQQAPRRHVVLDELQPGDYVVHADHGIGKFTGTLQMAPDDTEAAGAEIQREYLVLSYSEGDKLYVPMEHLDRVSQYLGGSDQTPSLTRLGTQEWTRVVARAKESTKRLAEDLLALYAQRELAEGIAHSPDTPWQREMEDSFPFQETPDQAMAIDDVKQDMEGVRPMDRLVCGDVGYGKTEVALRASFKAVMDGRQVAILVPTTVLAQQHYATFSERMSGFPVRLEVLSRFRTDAEQDAVVEKLKSGEVDVVIGTHRLLQKDVGFKDLGLVIIDEEHRFGVGHKEKLRSMRSEVDVLTMTATPIPRTLHMAMAGIRDVSSMDTPPEERLPIKTYLAESSDDLIREAILREIDREGQVFFLHNRVSTIYLTADKLRALVPDATILVAHGQMNEEELSQVMDEFAEGAADVLVCTTIIESGLDIPGVNTLIVDNADRFGLAQLYQLRGRVGRRAHRAYAYLLVQRGRKLTETAQRRLQTIMAATELGAGFRIAMKDLEIRGAGNILGAEQSGHIHAVGFELYARLLSEAVQELRAEQEGDGASARREMPEPIIDLDLPGFIPEDLVAHMPTRMTLYQRLARSADVDELEALSVELRERFGKLPAEVYNLLYSVRIRILARNARVESVVRRNDQVTMKLRDPAGGASLALQKALGHGVKVGHQQLHLPVVGGDVPWGQALITVLEELDVFQERALELALGSL